VSRAATKDDCPPKDAGPCDGGFFRRTRGHEAEFDEDWKTYAELGKKVAPEKQCQSRGSSVYRSADALRQSIANLSPSRNVGWRIWRADLRTEHGVFKQTGNDPEHHTLWLADAYNALDQRKSLFREEVKDP
jgi:hypothetical protein